MKTRILAGLLALLATPALAQQLESPTTITAAGATCQQSNCAEISMKGVLVAGINVEGSGTYTLKIMASKNEGRSWYDFNAIDESDPTETVQTITASGNFNVVNSGITNLKVFADTGGLTSGTPVVTFTRGYLEAINQLSGTGGGGPGGSATEYTENQTDASLTGIVMMMEGAANTVLPVQGTVADGILVNLGGNNDVTVTGTVTANLAAGTNNIGDVDIASIAAGDNNIGNVDIVSLPSVTIGVFPDNEPFNLAQYGGSAVGTGNAVHVQPGTGAAFPVTDNGGSITVDGSISCSNCTGTGASKVDDAAFSIASDSVAPAGFLADQTSPDSVNEGDVGLARMTLARIQLNTLWDAAGNERGANVNASNELLVALSSVPSHAVTNAGTFVMQENGAALTALQLIDNLVTTEDTASANGDSGLVAFARRTGTPANQSLSDGDYEPFQISAGRLWTSTLLTDGTDTALIDGSGNLQITGSVSCSNCSGSGASKVDDAAFTIATDSVAPAGFLADQTSPDSVNEGDVGLARMTLARIQLNTLWDAAGNERGLNIDANGEIGIGAIRSALPAGTNAIGKLAANSGVDIGDVDITSIAAGNNNIGDVDIASGTITTVSTVTTLSQLGGVALPIEDAAETAAGVGIYAMSVRRDTAASSANTTGDNATINTDSTGRLWTNTELPDAATLADDTTNPSLPAVAAYLMAFDGSTWDRARLASDMTVGSAFGTSGPGVLASYKDFDGTALPITTNVGTEEEAVPLAASQYGVGYFMPTNEDGSKTPLVDEDVASAGGDLLMKVAAIRDDTLDARSTTEGDYEPFHLNANGALWSIDVNSASALTALQLIDDPIFADDATFTIATSKVHMAGFTIDESSTDSADEGDAVAARATPNRILRNVNSGYLGGGGTPVNMISDSSDNEDKTAICTGPCTVYSISAFNHTAVSAFLRCENDTSANTTPGSETASDGEFNLEIPGLTTGAGFIYNPGAGIGASFSTALTCWIVSDEAATGTTDVAADDVRVQFVRVQ